jgi:hypothetical protein
MKTMFWCNVNKTIKKKSSKLISYVEHYSGLDKKLRKSSCKYLEVEVVALDDAMVEHINFQH